ncbi:MAG: acetylglutamate kinase [Alphaproteobacteria bacterium]|jgi:acetylglutamate kinase
MATIHTDTLPVVIKIGGGFFSSLSENQTTTNTLLSTISALQAHNRSVMLVHGGGEQVLKRLNDLNIASTRKEGLRITPDEHMPIVTGVLAGELNKQLVGECAKYAINAVGISLADGDIAICSQHPANIGAVGVPTAQNATLLKLLIQANMVPIIASIGKDENGRLYNVNADHAAICVAQLLQTKLYFFADVSGVLDASKQLIPALSANQSEQLIAQGVITDGMAVKVKAAQFAANEIGQSVTIGSWDDASKILIENAVCGTEILPEIA